MTDIKTLPDVDAPVSKFDLSTLQSILQSKEKVTSIFSELRIVIIAVILLLGVRLIPDSVLAFHWKVIIFAILLFIFGRCRKEKKGEKEE